MSAVAFERSLSLATVRPSSSVNLHLSFFRYSTHVCSARGDMADNPPRNVRDSRSGWGAVKERLRRTGDDVWPGRLFDSDMVPAYLTIRRDDGEG